MGDSAAALEKIRHDHRQHVSVNFPAPGICVSRCADSQPRWPCGAYRAASTALAVLKLADEAIPALGLMPADCTDACEDGPCNCSGQHRTVAWNLDPAKVREAITRELAGTPPNTPEGE